MCIVYLCLFVASKLRNGRSDFNDTYVFHKGSLFSVFMERRKIWLKRATVAAGECQNLNYYF